MPIQITRLKRLESDRLIAEVVEAQFVEIVAATAYVQCATPIIPHAFVDDSAAWFEALDPVGARAERGFKSGGGNIPLWSRCSIGLPPVSGQHIELADDLRQLPLAGRIECKRDLTLRRDLRFDNVSVIGRQPRIVLLENVEGKHDILRRHRRAVVPSCCVTQPITHEREIVRDYDGLGQQAVGARCLVKRWQQQAVIDKIDAGRQIALQSGDDNVEIIIRAEGGLTHQASLGSGRIDIIKPGKPGWVFEIAKKR